MKFADLVLPGEERWIKSRYYDYLEKSYNHSNAADEATALKYILTKNEKRVRTGSWSASSSGQCLRKQQFVYLGKKQRMADSKTLNIFTNGDYVHMRHQVAGLVSGYINDVEVPVHIPEYEVKGTVDAIADDYTVLEYKSINTYGFKDLEGPKLDHSRQVHAYMRAIGVSKGRILYEDKNNQDMKEYQIDWDDKVDALNVADWQQLIAATEERKLIPALPINSTECRWCPFARTCREETFE